jgi:hypothetical protein
MVDINPFQNGIPVDAVQEPFDVDAFHLRMSTEGMRRTYGLYQLLSIYFSQSQSPYQSVHVNIRQHFIEVDLIDNRVDIE